MSDDLAKRWDIIHRYTQGCEAFNRAVNCWLDFDVDGFESNLKTAATETAGALEWGLKRYLKEWRVSVMKPEEQVLLLEGKPRFPTFHQIMDLMRYADPKLPEDLSSLLSTYRQSLRNAAEHDASPPRFREMYDALGTIRNTLALYLRIDDKELSQPSILPMISKKRIHDLEKCFLAELAFRTEISSHESRGQFTTLIEEEVVALGQKHGLTIEKGIEQYLMPIISNHHLLRVIAESPKRTGFVYHQARHLYSALHLDSLELDELMQFVRDEGWRDVTLALAGVTSGERLEAIIGTLLSDGDEIFALACFLNRRREIEIDPVSRGKLQHIVENNLVASATPYRRAVMLDLLATHILNDHDDYFRFESVRLLENSPIPISLLRRFVKFLDQDHEYNDNIRAQIARVVATARIKRDVSIDLVEQYVRLLLTSDPYPPAFENKLIAVTNLLKKKTGRLSAQSLQVLQRATGEIAEYYSSTQSVPNRPIQTAMRFIRRHISTAYASA